MSIRDQVNDCCKDGRLFRLTGLLPGRPELREAYVSPDLYKLILFSDEDRWIATAQAFAHFIEGRLVVLPHEEKHHRGAFMLRLRINRIAKPPPPEIWEVRVTDPEPGIRVFGRFFERDAFVAFTWQDRLDLGNPYTEWKAREAWWAAAQRCRVRWANHFGSLKPLSGKYPNDYLTNAECH
jgi:hypothetical protein